MYGRQAQLGLTPAKSLTVVRAGPAVGLNHPVKSEVFSSNLLPVFLVSRGHPESSEVRLRLSPLSHLVRSSLIPLDGDTLLTRGRLPCHQSVIVIINHINLHLILLLLHRWS